MSWFIENFLTDSIKPSRLLDVGSLDFNGSYRSLVPNNFNYTGIDLTPGKNVDICIKNPYEWTEVATDEYDVVISGQALEHSPYFWLVFGEIVRVTKHQGLICLIVPRGFQKHRYPIDCWRFLTDGMIALCEYYQLEILHASSNAAPSWRHFRWLSKNNSDTFLIARKKYSGKSIKNIASSAELGAYEKTYVPKGWYVCELDGSITSFLLQYIKNLFGRISAVLKD